MREKESRMIVNEKYCASGKNMHKMTHNCRYMDFSFH